MPRTWEQTIEDANERAQSPYAKAQDALAEALLMKEVSDAKFKAAGLKTRENLQKELNSVITGRAWLHDWTKEETAEVRKIAHLLSMKYIEGHAIFMELMAVIHGASVVPVKYPEYASHDPRVLIGYHRIGGGHYRIEQD